eukprot:7741675-Ditylum_brightwellii.AAC.1
MITTRASIQPEENIQRTAGGESELLADKELQKKLRWRGYLQGLHKAGKKQECTPGAAQHAQESIGENNRDLGKVKAGEHTKATQHGQEK